MEFIRKKQKFILFCLAIILSIGFQISIPTVQASPSDSYKIGIGQGFIIECTFSLWPLVNQGKQWKYQIIAMNNTFLNNTYTGLIWLDVIYGKSWYRNSSSDPWTLITVPTDIIIMGRYNGSNYGFSYDGGLPGPNLACTNLTAYFTFENSSLSSNTVLNINNSAWNGLNFSYWRGYTDGTGANLNDYKINETLEPNTYVVEQRNYYTWNGSNWEIAQSFEMISLFDTNTNSPPIPGFTMVLIITSVTCLISLAFVWKKVKFNESK
ncbi:MAG: hypothetical protein EAX96_04975 [Candidatus Lokiarchaeota archaeon]|nr:hypothetical protein [Candidatus Lokiarchaeota archaeon]